MDITPLVKNGIFERRIIPWQDLEFRVDDNNDDKKPKIVGYSAMFNKRSQDLGGFFEQIAPGAFKKTIKEADVRALLNHDPNYVLGRNKSKTLSLSEDERGLRMECDPPETQWANDLMVSMKRGDIDQMSFGFRVIKDSWDMVGKELVRTLLEVQLFDVSVVTYPAYLSTSASVRSLLYTDEFAELVGVLDKVRSGLPLDESTDRSIIDSSFEKLRSLFPDFKPLEDVVLEEKTDGKEERQEEVSNEKTEENVEQVEQKEQQEQRTEDTPSVQNPEEQSEHLEQREETYKPNTRLILLQRKLNQIETIYRLHDLN